VLGDPDLTLVTLTELADLVRRICRAGAPPLLVDADHGFGNALGVQRTVSELHGAGAAGITVEDTLLPLPFGGEPVGLVSIDEAVGKLVAAVEAKPDAGFAIIARTSAYRAAGLDAALERVRHYAGTGVDAVFVTGLQRLDEVAAVRDAAAGLPLVLYASGPEITGTADLASLDVRLLIDGHMPIVAAAEAGWDALRGQLSHDAYRPRHRGLLSRLTRAAEFDERIARFLQPRGGTDHDR
jgi:carboxyvinyl-carboxyphosphonate phosphorylmutase